MTEQLGAADRPLRIAVVGAGPAGLYATESLQRGRDTFLTIELYNRNPTPIGLLRDGDAPDHQTINAQYLVREGAAVLIADRDLTPERLAAELKSLNDRGKLLAMAERARQVAKPQATEELAAACLEQLEAA